MAEADLRLQQLSVLLGLRRASDVGVTLPDVA